MVQDFELWLLSVKRLENVDPLVEKLPLALLLG
jgi:hypothetical protein